LCAEGDRGAASRRHGACAASARGVLQRGAVGGEQSAGGRGANRRAGLGRLLLRASGEQRPCVPIKLLCGTHLSSAKSQWCRGTFSHPCPSLSVLRVWQLEDVAANVARIRTCLAVRRAVEETEELGQLQPEEKVEEEEEDALVYT
jgi:hypothetical protein